jgi:hypothetical protein
MARTLIASDAFSGTLSNWTQTNSIWGSLAISSGQITSNSGSMVNDSTPSMRWTGSGTFTDDQYSSLTIKAFAFLDINYGLAVTVRNSTGADGAQDYYGAAVHGDGSGNYTTRLFKVVNATYTSLYSASMAWATNDVLSIEVEGTTLRLCKNGTAVGGSYTLTDSSLSTGVPGIAGQGGNTMMGDDWEGGNITAGSARGAPFGNRSTAFNGGRVFTGPIY